MNGILAAMLSVEGTQLTDNEKALLSKSNPIGITIFSRNIESKSQLTNLCSEIKETIGRDNVFIAVDQEGGRVRRLAEPEFRSYASQQQIGSLDLASATKASTLHATLISDDMKQCGFNLNYAPVLDVLYNDTSTALKSRCFGSDASSIAMLGKAMIEEYTNNGIISCIKHLPGHGKANIDPHMGLPIVDCSIDELQADFLPFITNNTCPCGMTAHILLPQIDDQQPITMSKKAISEVIRNAIGFEGLLISDAIDMGALKGSIGERAKHSLEAGCDAICYCFGKYTELCEVVDNCGLLTDKSLERLEKASLILNNHKKTDINNAENNYNNLIASITAYKDSYDATEILHKMQNK